MILIIYKIIHQITNKSEFKIKIIEIT